MFRSVSIQYCQDRSVGVIERAGLIEAETYYECRMVAQSYAGAVRVTHRSGGSTDVKVTRNHPLRANEFC